MKSEAQNFQVFGEEILVFRSELRMNLKMKDHEFILKYLLDEGLISGTYRMSAMTLSGNSTLVFYNKIPNEQR